MGNLPWKVVVPVSGGKDSQACLKLAVETHGSDNVLGLFCDTQFEHPLTYAHVDKLRALYGARIDTVCAGDVPSKVRRYGRFPSFFARFCTDELKIIPSKKIYTFIAELWQQGFEVWYGMRSDESDARKKRYAGKVGDEVYLPHEFMPKKYPQYLGKLGVRFRLPVLEWGVADVKEYVGVENLNPLYDTFDRVGCFPCLAAGDPHKEKAFAYDEFGAQQWQTVQFLQREIGKSVWTSKGGLVRNEPDRPGCAVCAM